MVTTITNAGLASNEVPALIIEFLDIKGFPEEELAVIPVKFLEHLIHKVAQER
jgi:hypothetical protein